MSETCDVIVQGAGIVGAACAFALTREKLRVIVVEPDTVGGGATAAGMGHIVVMDDSDAQFALTHYSRGLWDDLAPSLPPAVEFERRGTLWVAACEEEWEAVGIKAASYASRGVETETLDAQSLAGAEPNLRPGLAGALFVPGDSVIYAPCAAHWLLDQSGARVLPSANGIAAAHTVYASGTWSQSLFPDLPIRPRKGHLAITDRYPGFVRHQIVELGYLKSAHGADNESVAFNVQPRSTGQILIGSSRQYGATHSAVDTAILRRMLHRAAEFMPGLAGLHVIRCWTGFRAATPDNLPLIGRRGAAFLAAGHEGLGITTSLGTAQLIADAIMGRRPAIDPRPYLPERFHV